MIDIHVHPFEEWTPARIVRFLDEVGVERAWLLPYDDIDESEHLIPTRYVFKAYQDYPERFIPFCSIDPRRPNVLDKIKTWARRGCKGYGEHKVSLMIDDPRSKAVYKLCGELGLPVLVHIDVPLPPEFNYWKNPDVKRLEGLLEEFPDTIFIGHGPGWWREISADADEDPARYPTGKVKRGGRLDRILDEYPNVYGDLSAGSGLNALKRDPEFAREFLIRHRKKLLYGTDCFNTSLLDFLRSLNLPDDVFKDIVHNNAARIIPLE